MKCHVFRKMLLLPLPESAKGDLYARNRRKLLKCHLVRGGGISFISPLYTPLCIRIFFGRHSSPPSLAAKEGWFYRLGAGSRLTRPTERFCATARCWRRAASASWSAASASSPPSRRSSGIGSIVRILFLKVNKRVIRSIYLGF